MRKCLHCKKGFKPHNDRKNRKQKYCSAVCVRKVVASLGGKARDNKGSKNPNYKNGISKNHYHYKKIQKERYPERVKARDILYKAIKRGKIIRPNKCSCCGDSCKPHGHHDDYSNPLEVNWVCRLCHIVIHRENK